MIYLASASPRRAELLAQIGVEFEVRAVDIDETQLSGESERDYVCRLARVKAEHAAAEISADDPNYAILGADTSISLDGDIIGKPADQAQCRCILGRLSGREHLVLSAVALARPDGVDLRLRENRVRFRSLSAEEINLYCASEEPMDKAGAYAIQGRAAIFIEHLEGSYSAVMGLPLYETAELLRNVDLI